MPISWGTGKPLVGTVVQVVSIIKRMANNAIGEMIKCSSRSCGGLWSTRTDVRLECGGQGRTMSHGWMGCGWESHGEYGK